MPPTSQQRREPETVFFDDFTSSGLDRSQWNVELTGPVYNEEQQAYIDSAETVYTESGQAEGANGALVIHPRYSPGFVTPQGNTFDFTSGRITTQGRVEFMYGSVAARMKFTSSPGLWPAFWAMGSDKPWPANGEIDIMENVGDPSWTNIALHGPGYSGDTPFVNKKSLPGDNDVTRWHIYSVDWRPEGLWFRTDGEVTYQVTRPMVEKFGPWAYDNHKFILLNCALGGAYPVSVNGIRSPYLGMSEATVQLIKDNCARVLIDWVKVTRTGE